MGVGEPVLLDTQEEPEEGRCVVMSKDSGFLAPLATMEPESPPAEKTPGF
jgi:hypothetical protein